jgi:aspartyl-tRNA(Asn)/glutamyl-tRNA(Gln) amidotransferase subunit C
MRVRLERRVLELQSQVGGSRSDKTSFYNPKFRVCDARFACDLSVLEIRNEPDFVDLLCLTRCIPGTLHGVETITDAEIAHLKKLARLEMDEAETALAQRDINKILESFEALQKLDLDGLPEMPRPVPLTNIMREDVVEPGFTQAEAMSVAVDAEDGFFKVPRIVE